MKLTISNQTLLEQLTHVVGAIEKKHTSKILENVYLKASAKTLNIVATDLEIEMSANLDIQVDDPGETTVPARKLFDICKALPSDCFVLLETDDKQRIHIKGLRSKFELATLPATDFPLLDKIPISDEINIQENTFKELLDNVSFSMANQDVRYYLNGMLLEFSGCDLFAVTTDGHRLAISKYTDESKEISLNKKIIVPRKGILELSRLLDSTCKTPITLQISDNHIRINKHNIRFTSKLIDGKYPDYQAAIPASCKYSIVLDKELFKSTLSRVAILSNEKFRGIRLTLNNGTMFLHSNNPDNESAEEELDIEFSDDVFEIGFNVTYLLDAVNHIDDSEICLDLLTPDSSALLYSKSNPDTRYVVMPIRL